MARIARAWVKRLLPKQVHPPQIVARWIERKTDGKVFSGPFAGMKYVETAVGSRYYPKILGTYEKELHEAIKRLSQNGFDIIVNIGAGEGYYAVGLALLYPNVPVVAYEMESKGQELIRHLSRLNSVENRVTVRGFCSREGLSNSLRSGKKALVVMDVEGGEVGLLNPTAVPELQHPHILVEVHNFISPNADSILKVRFTRTHRISRIPAVARRFDDFPIPLPSFMSLLPRIYFKLSMGERPEGMCWLYLEPITPTC